MRKGVGNPLVTGLLAVGFACIAKDLLVPLMGLAAFGLIDRTFGPARSGRTA